MIPDRFSYLKSAPCPPWLTWALAEVAKGVRETPGPKSTARILEYRKIAHIPLGGEDGVVPWCAIGVNAALEACGVPGSRSAMARSFIGSAPFTRLKAPILGAICVKSSNRGPASGHVGFYVGEDGLFYYMAGGNQDDAWTISAFPKKQFVGFFYPKGQPEPAAPWNLPYKLPRPQLPHEKKKLAAASPAKPVKEA